MNSLQMGSLAMLNNQRALFHFGSIFLGLLKGRLVQYRNIMVILRIKLVILWVDKRTMIRSNGNKIPSPFQTPRETMAKLGIKHSSGPFSWSFASLMKFYLSPIFCLPFCWGYIHLTSEENTR